MIVRRRICIIAVAFSLLGAIGARGQVLTQLPANPQVVIKVNNPEAVSKKIGDMMKRLGLANLDPDLADPLGTLKKHLNLKDGFDGTGEMAIALYPDPGNGGEPLVIAVLPVTDYKTFLGGLSDVKDEGAGLSSFVPTEGADRVYITNWGKYAAASDNKAAVSLKPGGFVIASAAARAQMDKSDAAMFANTKLIAGPVLPMLQAVKPQVLMEVDAGLAGIPNMNAKFVPAIKALVAQVLNTAEQTLTDTTGAAVAINITDKGVVTTVVADFAADSYIGKLMAMHKNTNADLLVGLPDRKYFAEAGAAPTPAANVQLLTDWLAPIVKELVAAGPDGKPLADILESATQLQQSSKSVAAGYAVPTGPPGTQAITQVAMAAQCDAAKMSDFLHKYFDSANELMKIMPNNGLQTELKFEPGAANIGGTQLDKLTMKFTADPANAAAQQVKPIIDMIYGPNGISGVVGAVNPGTFVEALGGDDAFMQAVVAAAKTGNATLSQLPHIKTVAAQLPANRSAVVYVHLDNIVTTALAYANQFGLRIPLKLQDNIPPLGMSMGTENTALRIDVVIPNELIENAVAATMQIIMLQQGGGAPPAGL